MEPGSGHPAPALLSEGESGSGPAAGTCSIFRAPRFWCQIPMTCGPPGGIVRQASGFERLRFLKGLAREVQTAKDFCVWLSRRKALSRFVDRHQAHAFRKRRLSRLLKLKIPRRTRSGSLLAGARRSSGSV